MVGDQAASEFNVTWMRTTPIVVSCIDDAINTYITGASSLRMGMDVNGTASNVRAFRFACSSAFSPIEYMVAASSTGSSLPNGLSVTLGLGERILNGETPELFMSNGYLVYKIQGKDDIFLLLDPETGIVTDCALGIHGMYCFHDLITDQTVQLGENLTSTDPNVQPVWLGLIGGVVMGAASAEVAGTGSAFIGGTGVLGLSAGTAILYGGAFIGISIGVAAMLYEPYLVLYVLPEKLRILKEINDMKKNQTLLWIGTLSLFLPEDREPTPEELQEAQWKAGQLLMTIAENNDIELYNELIEIGNLYLKGKVIKKEKVGDNTIIVTEDGQIRVDPGPIIDPKPLADAILKICRFIKDQGVNLVNGVKAGDPAAVIAAAGGISLGTSGLVLLLEATFDVTEYWDAFKDLWEQDTNNTGNITPGT